MDSLLLLAAAWAAAWAAIDDDDDDGVEVDVLEDDVCGAILTLWLLLLMIVSFGILLLLQLGPGGESGGE